MKKLNTCDTCHRQGKDVKSFCKACKVTNKKEKHSYWIRKTNNPHYVQMHGCMNSDFLYGDDGDIY